MKRVERLTIHGVKGLRPDEIKKKLPYKTVIDYKPE
jgi:hypothetical protein